MGELGDGALRISETSRVLKKLGYEYMVLEEEPEEPEVANVKFSDFLPELARGPGRAREIAFKRLYKHQLEALEALSSDFNVILVSGTGSGKTEAWAFHALKNRLRALVVYPTLALSRDQINRLVSYYEAVGLRDAVVEVDRPTVDKLGYSGVRRLLARAKLVITNPAFLMADIKRMVSRLGGVGSGPKSVLKPFLELVDLVVLDELDFYGSRRATLLLDLVSMLANYVTARRPQVVVLTATLGNPDEVAEHLTKLNGKPTKVIRGRAFRAKNKVYMVLGKNLKELWERVRGRASTYLHGVPELEHFIKDYETFKSNVFVVLDLLSSAGYRVPEPSVDLTELLAEYVESDETGVTVVFTPSIRSAESLARKLIDRLVHTHGYPESLARELVATHHHLLSPEVRSRVEEAMRDGKVRVVFTVRTLLQGIDVPTVVRVVHYGVPTDVREYRQREGRKGRRLNVPFTETVIVPVTPHDRKLAELSPDALVEYVNLPSENVYVNPDNGYVKLFNALFKVLAGHEDELTDDEAELLKTLKLVSRRPTLHGPKLFANERGRSVWARMNFYEYGLPYGGIKVMLGHDGTEKVLDEQVSRRDLVEKYQPGCLDYANDAVVVRVVGRKVLEQDLKAAIGAWGFLAEAYDGYVAAKVRMGEEPDIVKDFRSGRLTSVVACRVTVPASGFGLMHEEPEAVYWRLEPRRPKVIRVGDEVRVVYESRKILVTADVSGSYEDFTYGYTYELDPEEPLNLVRVGLAALIVLLRLSELRLPLWELAYSVEDKPKKVMRLWEADCCGVLRKLDWRRFRGFVLSFKPPKIFELMMWAVDEEASRYVAEEGLSWDEIKTSVLRVLDYIMGVERIGVRGLGELELPRKLDGLRAVAVEAIALPDALRAEGDYLVVVNDGVACERVIVSLGREPTGVNRLRDLVANYVDKGFTVLHYGQGSFIEKLAESSAALKLLLKGLEAEGRLVNVHKLVKEVLGLDPAPPDFVRRALGLQEREVSGRDVSAAVKEAKRGKPDKALSILAEHGESNTRLTIQLWYALSRLRSTTDRGDAADRRGNRF